jgi:hypothetical protein
MSIRQLWRKFWALPQSRRAMIFEASFWLVLARLVILFVPFPWIARRIGRLQQPGTFPLNQPRDSTLSIDGPDVAQSTSWAIDRAARALPVRLVCLPRALAAWQMLRRRGIEARMHFGASRNAGEESLNSHAWVDAYGVEVTGYPEAHNCVEIGFFAQY